MTPTKTKYYRYANDGNTVVRRYAELEHVANNLYKTSLNSRSGQSIDYVLVYPNAAMWVENHGAHLDTISVNEETAKRYAHLQDEKAFIAHCDKLMCDGKWLNNLHIQIAASIDAEKAAQYKEYHDQQLEERQRRREEQRRNLEEAEWQREAALQAQREQAIMALEKQFREKTGRIDIGYIGNTRDNNLLELAKKYGVELPPKLKHWIKNRLAAINCENGHFYSYAYSGSKSTTFWNYLQAIDRTIFAASVTSQLVTSKTPA